MKNDISLIIKNAIPTMSKSQKKIADLILKNYDKVAYMTATKLAAMAEISESTVVRFAIELGYNGYPEFQRALQELVRTNLTPNQRIALTNLRIGDSNVLDKLMTSDIEKIKHTLENIDKDSFDRAVDAITEARMIYIIGARSSFAIAQFLAHNLMLIFDNVKFIQESSESEIFEQAISIGEKDVLFAVSFPRYSTRVIHAVNFAHARKARVVSLTDSTASPIAEGADFLLTAQSDMAAYVDSLVAPLSLVNALIVSITRKKQDEIKERFDSLESIWDDYNVYAKK
ncbi:MAG: MurR/RpiR family transcriptional regulator [Eubacteriales bacterium]|nr:MurR/RpiR family transcriptional regulator [Eubacteriales bacterium]